MDYIVPIVICVLFYMFSYKVPPFHSSHCSNIAFGQLRIIGYHDDLEISFSQKINLYIYNMGLKKKYYCYTRWLFLSWWLRNCFSKKKMYKYNLGLKKLLVNTRRLFVIM